MVVVERYKPHVRERIVMRLYLCISSILVVLLLGACSRESSNPVDEYGKTLISSLSKAERAQLTVNLRTIRTAIDAFSAENGRYPETLDELRLGGDVVSAYYDYDSDTGRVAVTKQ